MKQNVYKSYDELPLMLSVSEVAFVLGISRAGAYELVRGSGFPSMKIGSRIVTPKDKLMRSALPMNSPLPRDAPLQKLRRINKDRDIKSSRPYRSFPPRQQSQNDNKLLTLKKSDSYSTKILVWCVAERRRRTVYDYMIALKERFYQPSHTEWDDQIQMLRRELANRLDKPHRKKLLRLLDAESMLQEEISLASFVAEFRLATGIAREFSLEESYSFAKETEKYIVQRLRREEGADHG